MNGNEGIKAFSKAYERMNIGDDEISFVEKDDSISVIVDGIEAGYVDFEITYLDRLTDSFEEMELGFNLRKLAHKVTYGERLCYVELLYVKSEFRYNGLATNLVKALIERMHGIGIFQIVLRAEPDTNTIPINSLVSFYRRFGFKEIDRTEEGGVLMLKL